VQAPTGEVAVGDHRRSASCIRQVRRTVAQHLDHEDVSSQRPDGGCDLIRRLALGALAHDHEHVAPPATVSVDRPNRCSQVASPRAGFLNRGSPRRGEPGRSAARRLTACRHGRRRARQSRPLSRPFHQSGCAEAHRSTRASDRVVGGVLRDALGRRSSRGRRPTRRRISRQLTHVGSSKSPSILSRRTPSRGDQSDRSVKQSRRSSTTGVPRPSTQCSSTG
jgi:hypothetical protein